VNIKESKTAFCFYVAHKKVFLAMSPNALKQNSWEIKVNIKPQIYTYQYPYRSELYKNPCDEYLKLGPL
jgi:hypothetical protein